MAIMGMIRMTMELERQKEKIHRIEPKTIYKELVTMDQDSSELFEHRPPISAVLYKIDLFDLIEITFEKLRSSSHSLIV